MLQSMGLKRVRYDVETEQNNVRSQTLGFNQEETDITIVLVGW